MLKTLDQKLKARYTALIIVDYQNDFCHEDGVFNKERLIPGQTERSSQICFIR
jgi:hypothetical protein